MRSEELGGLQHEGGHLGSGLSGVRDEAAETAVLPIRKSASADAQGSQSSASASGPMSCLRSAPRSPTSETGLPATRFDPSLSLAFSRAPPKGPQLNSFFRQLHFQSKSDHWPCHLASLLVESQQNV